jgi:sec-independent protein translocase protein TatB
VFNLSGSELIVLLLVALIILGPERLPEAVRSFGRVYGQIRRMGEGFQAEMRSVLDEPIREVRDTAELARRTMSGDDPTPTPP